MLRKPVLRLVVPQDRAPERGAKVIALRSRRTARLERILKQPTRPDAA
jgi:hypothetical protein